MASAFAALPGSLRPLIRRHRRIRSLPCRSRREENDAGNFSRFSFLDHPNSPSLHPSLSICLCFHLRHHPLRALLRNRSPSLRYPLPLMTSTDSQAAPESSPSIPTRTVRVVVKGRVQGVFYRDWTVKNATELLLKGWVRNRRDGSVEALFSGSPGSVQEMEQRCRRGPPAAMVTGLQVFPSTDDPGPGFEHLRTV